MWQDEFLDEIRKIDHGQAPHGLYGIREILGDELRKKGSQGLPPLSTLLGGKDPRTGIAQRLGWSVGGGTYSRALSKGWLSFGVPSTGIVLLRLEAHASTKVRLYGGAYVMDKVHGKKPAESPDLLESAVPEVRRDAKAGGETPGLLFIAHVHTPRGFRELLGRTSSGAFLEKYQLSLHSRTWEDIHGRRFHTGLFLWTAAPRELDRKDAPD